MLGRDSRTVSKLFEEVVGCPGEYKSLLGKAKEVLNAEQRKFIEGLRY